MLKLRQNDSLEFEVVLARNDCRSQFIPTSGYKTHLFHVM